MNCPHCSEALSERGVFCTACAGQARCMSCREVSLLEPGPPTELEKNNRRNRRHPRVSNIAHRLLRKYYQTFRRFTEAS
jgi:hypothetical protein